MTHELERRAGDLASVERDARHLPDPVADGNAAEMACMEREAAQTVVNRLAFIDLNRQRIVRTMADHDVGAGIDRGVRDLRHVIEHVLMQAPVARGNHVIALRLQRSNVVCKRFQ